MRPENESGPVRNYRGKGDNGLMSFKDIAKAMGLGDAASAHQIYNRAMWKLRLRYGTRKHEITDLYVPEPEPCERWHSTQKWRVSELSLGKFPMQPRRFLR